MKAVIKEVLKQKKSGVVCFLGRPNVGKSTLLNTILRDEISIVTPKAQTTRDQIRGIFNDERGQIVFIDTPGVHRAREGGINAYMVQEVRRSLEDPDVILYIIDPMNKPSGEKIILDLLNGMKAPLFVLVNKTDLKKKYPAAFDWIEPWVAEIQAACPGFVGIREISATRKKGIAELVTEVFEKLPIGPALYEDAESLTDRSVRFVVSELIRKQLFLNLGDEIPYSCGVEIESYQEKKKPVHISSTIFVERESQKGMVIGAGGKKIKQIGSEARKEIEKLIGEKVFLELRVKVLATWTSEKNKMKRFGYALEK